MEFKPRHPEQHPGCGQGWGLHRALRRGAVALPPEPGQTGKATGVGEFVVIKHQCLQGWEPQNVPLACQRCYRCLPVRTKILGKEQGQGISSTIPRKKWRIRNEPSGITSLGTSLVQKGPEDVDLLPNDPFCNPAHIYSLLYGEGLHIFTDRRSETGLGQDGGGH